MVLLRKEDYPEIETGEYVAQLIEVKSTQSKRNPQFGPSVRFAFRILEQPYLNAVVSGLTSAKLLAGNKLDKWLGGLGYNLDVDGELDTDKLTGRIVRIFVERDEGSKYTNVRHIYGLRDQDKPRIDPKAKLIDTSAGAPSPSPEQPTSAEVPVQTQANTQPSESAGSAAPLPDQTAQTVQTPPPAAPQPPAGSQSTPQQPRNIPF